MLSVWMGSTGTKFASMADPEELSIAEKVGISAAKSCAAAIIPLMSSCWILPLTAFVLDNYVSVLPGFVFGYSTVMHIFSAAITVVHVALLLFCCACGIPMAKEQGGGDSGIACCGCIMMLACMGSLGVGIVVKVYEEYRSLMAYGALVLTYFVDVTDIFFNCFCHK